MYQVSCELEWNDDWRLRERVPLDGEVTIAWSGRSRETIGRAIDLSESGLSFVCSVQPKVGDHIRVQLDGFWIDATVRNVVKQGRRFRVGAENS